MVPSLVFWNDVVMGIFSGARSLSPFPFIMRNNSLENVSLCLFLLIFYLLQYGSRWARIFWDRGLAFDFNRLRATLVAILVFVNREFSACTFHLLDDSLWVGSRPCSISEYCRLGADLSISLIVRYESPLTLFIIRFPSK